MKKVRQDTSYRKVVRKNGATTYVVTEPKGKTRFIKKADIPKDILEQVDKNNQYTDDGHAIGLAKVCLFCGQYAPLTRFLNLKTVALCNEHYYSETIGKIAAKIREKENAFQIPKATEVPVREEAISG